MHRLAVADALRYGFVNRLHGSTTVRARMVGRITTRASSAKAGTGLNGSTASTGTSTTSAWDRLEGSTSVGDKLNGCACAGTSLGGSTRA